MAGVDRDDLLERIGGLRVIDELLFEQQADALEQRDALLGRGRQVDLRAQALDQALEVLVARVDALETLERGQLARLDRERGLVARRGLVELAEPVLVQLAELRAAPRRAGRP